MKKANFIKVLSVAALCTVSLSSCIGTRSLRAQEVKADLALREMRSQVEDCKYRINKYEVELQIVESKADSQGASLNKVRQDISKLSSNDQGFIESTFASYDKKIERLEGIEQSLKKDLIGLKDRTNEVLASLAQFKSKLDTNEGQLSDQKRYIEHLKTSLEALMKYVQEPMDEDGVFYVVRPGDSLERIAKENETTIDKIRGLNHITSDLVVVGQRIRLK
ncbi:MAG: hypothetical protein S4CHLAM6_05470 [Chlamydiae bacterium]|nr:hypothetical protein [Chlamydiota bacterium]